MITVRHETGDVIKKEGERHLLMNVCGQAQGGKKKKSILNKYGLHCKISGNGKAVYEHQVWQEGRADRLSTTLDFLVSIFIISGCPRCNTPYYPVQHYKG